ncbi:hypothetical protein BK125_26500 [Paenibacillus odorifer]|jgi:hypothetical protein|uniref:Uncharacterized protein n=1 Tax=Paenibacillus odorifer TaxID=189426 RepID=A0ABX3GFT7_9BACL|nr:hypothetical protein [Paenibacillus odorifer]OMC70426.1 hypothetical protein BK125_26500 [Paenibacillus odorifer]OMC95508.1 hypothetical protein BSO21_33790 [Paenibacillus odorifer]OME09306.1 hypothetical protein BSK64_02135 [Paenibacillus odorifer]
MSKSKAFPPLIRWITVIFLERTWIFDVIPIRLKYSVTLDAVVGKYVSKTSYTTKGGIGVTPLVTVFID